MNIIGSFDSFDWLFHGLGKEYDRRKMIIASDFANVMIECGQLIGI